MKNIFTNLLALILIGMWSYAAFSKLFGIHYFIGQLKTHQLFAGHEIWIAWMVPIVEIIISLMLLVPATRKPGFVASSVLLFIFTLYIIYMFKFYAHTPCTCGGIISQLSWRQHIAFNSLFLLLSIAASRWEKDTGYA